MRRSHTILFLATAMALGAGCSDGKKRRSPNGGTSTSGGVSSGATAGAGSGGTTIGSGSGTTGGSVATRPSRFLYSANYGDSSITQLSIDASTGALAEVASFPLGDAPLRLVAHPNGAALWAIERSEITTLAIDATTGALAPIGAPLVIAGDFPMAACATPDGALLIATYYGGGPGASVRAFAIGATGALTEVSRHSLGSSAQPVDVIVDARSRVAWVVDEIAFTITPLSIVPGAGTLTPVGGPVTSADVRALALDSTGAFLVAMTSASPGSIRSFAVSPTGALAVRSAPLSMGPHSPMAITRGPDGRFYVVTANSSLVVATIDAQGTLTEASVTSIPAHGFPNALAIDAAGKFIYTANFAGDDVSTLTIGSSGAIAAGPANVPVTPRTAGNTTQPSWLVAVR